MNFNAQIICRKTNYGAVCEWQGPRDGIAKMTGEIMRGMVQDRLHQTKKITENVYEVGRLRIRVVAYPVLESYGAPFDSAAIMLESPHAQLYWLWRQWAEGLIRLLSNVETRLWAAYCGLRLRPFPEGSRLQLTGWLADKIL